MTLGDLFEQLQAIHEAGMPLSAPVVLNHYGGLLTSVTDAPILAVREESEGPVDTVSLEF